MTHADEEDIQRMKRVLMNGREWCVLMFLQFLDCDHGLVVLVVTKMRLLLFNRCVGAGLAASDKEVRSKALALREAWAKFSAS